MQGAPLTFSYTLDFRDAKRNMLGFGFRVPEYRCAKWPPYPEYEAVGRIESELFDCVAWRNDYPNPAFVRMTARDAFWAAKILMRFTREELDAIVETGEFSNPDHAAYLADVLVERQQKCGRFGINVMNPLAEFRIEGGRLDFTNLSERYGFVDAETRYQTSWSSFDNLSGEHRRLSEPVTSRDPRLELPDSGSAFLCAEIHSLNEENLHWNTAVLVYLRRSGSGYEIVGIESENTETFSFPMR
jgi:hypothetical protein